MQVFKDSELANRNSLSLDSRNQVKLGYHKIVIIEIELAYQLMHFQLKNSDYGHPSNEPFCVGHPLG